MKHYIFGAGEMGRRALEALKSENRNVIAFVDNNPDLHGKIVHSLPVVALHEVDADGMVLIAVGDRLVCEAISVQVVDAGVKNGYVITPAALWEGASLFDDKGQFDPRHVTELNGKPVLAQLETHIADHCNLNCRGCFHFSNICTSFLTPLSTFHKDMRQLATLFSNALRFRIMGGEPLLNPDFHEYCAVARAAFPYGNIRLVTNGILLRRISDEAVKTLRDNKIVIDITPYPPTMRMMEDLRHFLTRHELMHCLVYGSPQETEDVTTFRNFLGEGKAAIPHRAVGCNCAFLRHGQVSKCVLPFMIHVLNDYAGTDYKVDHGDIANIYEIDGCAFINFVRRPIPFCSYCRDEDTVLEWKATHNDACLSDWVVESGIK